MVLKLTEAVQYGLIAMGAFILACVTFVLIKVAFSKTVSILAMISSFNYGVNVGFIFRCLSVEFWLHRSMSVPLECRVSVSLFTGFI